MKNGNIWRMEKIMVKKVLSSIILIIYFFDFYIF